LKPDLRANALRIFDSLRSTSGFLDPSSPNRTLNSLIHPEKSLTPHHLAWDTSLIHSYLAVCLPSNFAAVRKVLTELYSRIPEFSPKGVLDFGTGPGTAIWALNSISPNGSSFPDVIGVDVNQNMLSVAEKIAKSSELSSSVSFSSFLPASANVNFFSHL
jgi:ribosomal protein RSM22 (predicted rRNA methylase)